MKDAFSCVSTRGLAGQQSQFLRRDPAGRRHAGKLVGKLWRWPALVEVAALDQLRWVQQRLGQFSRALMLVPVLVLLLLPLLLLLMMMMCCSWLVELCWLSNALRSLPCTATAMPKFCLLLLR